MTHLIEHYKTKGAFSSDAIVKQFYLATINANTKWSGQMFAWTTVCNELINYIGNPLLKMKDVIEHYRFSLLPLALLPCCLLPRSLFQITYGNSPTQTSRPLAMLCASIPSHERLNEP
jgi:hypothetical protein